MILLGNGPDVLHPAVTGATMGALFKIQPVRCSVAEFAKLKTRRGWNVIGTSPTAELDFDRHDYGPDPIIFLGSERKGLSREDHALCDAVVRIPMTRSVDSLNLGVAGSLILYEAFRQRRSDAMPGPA